VWICEKKVDLNRGQTEALFHLMDVDIDAHVSYEEFISFLSTVKRMEFLQSEDPNFEQHAFPPDQVCMCACVCLYQWGYLKHF
jgi:hypothetical protein